MFHNNGLLGFAPSPLESDLGRFNVTGDPSDKGRFKTPTLRNIELTPPYMHDGRFKTLEEVIEHYNSGVNSTDTIDPVMQTGNNKYGLNLSDINKQALVAFLKTFTDTSIITDQKYANPFK